MKKQKLISELKIIESKLIDYFNDVEEGKKNGYDSTYTVLKVLDCDRRKDLKPFKYTLNGYTGVTIQYLMKYLFNNKYSFNMISYQLLNLLDKKEIRSIYCSNIKDVVFENKKNPHATTSILRLKEREEYNKYYRSYKSINSYLNNNKIENSNS